MSLRKEKLLKKYIEKKKKQRKRDDLFAQIVEIDKLKGTCKEEKRESKPKKKIEIFQVGKETKLFGEEETSCSLDQIETNNAHNDFSTAGIDNPCDDTTHITDQLTTKDCSIDTVDSSSAEHANDNLEVSRDFDSSKLEFKEVRRSKEIQEARQKLPVFYEQANVISCILRNAVVIIKGATGSGKTTQIPQFLYERGFSNAGLICITQPRRISTISICSRLKEELCADLCGYKIRYDANFKSYHHLLVMTDGVLLKEIREDFLLSKYSVVVLDEIHERSVNMDILLSLLVKIIKLRKENGNELKLILMSACDLDSRLLEVFKDAESFTVPSSPHKLSIFYENETPDDLLVCALECIKKIVKKKNKDNVLVFLPSKLEIYKLKTILDNQIDAVVLPLHGSLSKKEQALVYKSFGKTKVILSTNIAETSLTIPDITYIVDSGLVKSKFITPQGIVQYSTSFISKASAQQRAGRAGRTCPGFCYRLYSGESYNSFSDADTPKILYEPLDEVVLNLIALGVPNVLDFPFFCPPPKASLTLALNNLKRLRYIDRDNKLTTTGEVVSRLPIHPSLGRLFCLPDTSHIFHHLVTIVSCLSVNLELKRNKENESYFVGEKSDIVVLTKIFYDYLKSQTKKEFCEKINLNYSSLVEATKLRQSMFRKLKKPEDLAITEEQQTFELLKKEKDQLRKLFFEVFIENMAIYNTSSYLCKGLQVHLSASSIDTDEDYVVFEYLTQGSKKVFMKNVTVVDKEWLSNNK